MKKKKLLSISLLCLFGMIVTACGGKPSSKPESQPASENPSSEVTPASSNEPGTSEAVNPSSAAPSSQAPSSQAPSSAQPSSEAPVNPTGVTLDKQSASVIKGQTLQLTATVAPANANNKEITWSSSDEDVITVSKTGLVTAVEVGSAKITAKIKNTQLKAECNIDVIKQINSIAITNKAAFANFVVDDMESLNITVDPADNVTALLNAGALKVTSSNESVISVSGLSVLAKAKGTAKVTATLFGKEDSVDITVGDAIPGVAYQILAALNKGIEEAPWNGSTGKNGAITTTCFELQGKMIALAPNGATGYNAILDDGTQAVYLQINKLESDPIPFEVGDYAKVTCKFINYYGLLEGVSRKAATGDNASWIPSKDVEKIDAPATPITPFLAAPEAMTGAQYDAYYAICQTNGTKNAAGATWTSLKYVSILGEYSEEYVNADKGKYKISDTHGLAPIGSFELDEPFEGQKSTLEAFLIGANTGKSKSNAIVTGQTPVAVESVSFAQESVSLVRGNTVKVEYVTAPAGSYDRAVAWSSSDATVATVENGNVLGVYQGEGSKTATIKVTLGTGANAKEATIAVEVFGEEIHAGSVELASTASVYVGKTVQLTATTTPAMVSDVAQWSSSDETVATVDNKGLVSGLKAGTANITVRYNENVSATCAVTVSVEPGTDADHPLDVAAAIEIGSGLSHNKETETEYFVKGIISKIVSNDFGTDYNNGTFWLANGETVVEGFEGYRCKLDTGVSADNFKVGAEAILRCKIKKYNTTIETGSVAQIVSLTYAARPATSLTLNKESVEMGIGGQEELTASFAPVYTTETLTWSSSDTAVATVANGVITAVAAGNAVITARFSETVYAECAVTVTGGAPSVLKATLKYSGTTTTNMAATGNAATVGLDATLFSVDADKGEQNNFPGLNKAGDIRLYSLKSADATGNGASFTVTIASGYVIDSIKVDYKQASEDARVYAGSTLVTGNDEFEYDINASSFKIQNGYKSDGTANTQVQINKVEISYREAGSVAEEEAMPWYTEGTGNQAIHFEGAGIWTWVKYDVMGYANFDEFNAAKDSFVAAYESEPAANIMSKVVSDDNATLKYARVYISLDAAYNTGVLTLTIPAKDGSKNYVGTLEFAAGELVKINGEEVVAPVAQPVGGFHGVVKLIAAAGGARQPVDMTLTADSAAISINGQALAVTSYNWDGESVITLVTEGNYGTIKAQYTESSNSFAVTSVSGSNAAYIDTANPVVLHGNALFYDCNGTTAELQATFARRYYRSGVDANWAYDTGNSDRITSVSDPAVEGNALKLRPITAGANNRVALTLLNDFAEARPTTTIGFWVYNSAENDVTLRAWGYPVTGKASNFEYVNVDGSGSMVAKAGQWTYIMMTYYSGGTAQQKNIYNFQIADMNSTQGETLYFDNICLL